MDANDGEILAMGSAPTFDPAIFTRPITQRQYKELTSRGHRCPAREPRDSGRSIRPGRSFKPITAIAALEDKLITPEEIYNDDGEIKLDVLTLHNASDAVYGPINMSDAFKVSSDLYFYNSGLEANVDKGQGGPIQDWARRPRPRRADRDRPPRRGRGAGARPRPGATGSTARS